MLLRLTVPLLETSSTGAAQLQQRLSILKKSLLKQTNRAYRPPNQSPIHSSTDWTIVPGDRPNASQKYKQNDSRLSEHSHNGKKKLLAPYDLSLRVDALCQNGELLEAISAVKGAPLDAQNAIVWATLIRSVIGVGRYQEAYRLFIDMKRRGIRPSSRTFSTLLKGYAQINDWERFPLQLDNVCSIYDQLKHYHGMVQNTGGPEEELSNIPYNLLIGIFGKAQRFQRMFDVFNAMPSKGPLAPDIRTFTALITAIGNRQLSAFPHAPADNEGGDTSTLTANELAHKNASDVKLIWRQLLRVCRNPDSYAIRAILKPLSRGRPSDQTFALDIAYEYLGLSRPGEQSAPAKLQLHERTLESVLITSNLARRYRSTLHYIQQVIDSNQAVLLNRQHMDLALQAHAALACTDPGESEQALETLQWMLRMQALPPIPRFPGFIGLQIRPALSTYDTVALACWNAGDWPSVCRAFELMTSFSAEGFRGEMHHPPTKDTHGQGLRPSAMFMSLLIKTAAKTRDLEDIRQALNILEYFDLGSILRKAGEAINPGQRQSQDASRRRDSQQALYASKLVEALHTVLPRMLESADYNHATKMRWNHLLSLAGEG